ncbi:MAG: glycosyltransferase family 2 protein [Burkholderiaceae bacterium]|nr:glycosyltransferase family 2 protein [Gammaproteobacteria bacterium]
MGLVTVSIISHGHGALLPGLLEDLAACPEVSAVVLTRNIPEPDIAFAQPERLTVIDNPRPKGFGTNHNAAFRAARTPFFLVLNPDVRLEGNPFPTLLACLEDERIALCAPAAVNPTGTMECSARQFPSPTDLMLKAFGRYDGHLQYALGDPPRTAPWVAGMFMLIRSTDYAAIGGFDEGFFLYYEDVDLCARLWRSGQRVTLCPAVQVVHDARRASHRNLRHMGWHAVSMARYFRKYTLRPGLPAP